MHFLSNQAFLVTPSDEAEYPVEWLRSNSNIQRVHPQTRLYETTTHNQLLSFLLGKATALTEGKFGGQRGTACNLLVGAKGIGKTTVMTVFAHTAKLVFPRLAVMYISFNNNTAIIDLIVRALREHCNVDVATNAHFLTLEEALVDVLCRHGLYLMLLVDDLEQLYRLDPNSATWAMPNLGTLAYFGNQPSGMISTLLCGSSSALEDLIAARGKEVLVADFPLLRTAISLNETKFKTRRLYSPLPTDLTAVSSMCDYGLARLRAIAFLSGCTARGVQESRKITERSLSGETDVLMRKIMKALARKNHRLLRTLLGHGQLTVEDVARNVQTIAWETMFLPLTYSEVEVIWRRVVTSERRGIQYNVLRLSDQSWITFAGVKENHPEYIYPSSMIRLVGCLIDENSYLHLQERLLAAASRTDDCFQTCLDGDKTRVLFYPLSALGCLFVVPPWVVCR